MESDRQRHRVCVQRPSGRPRPEIELITKGCRGLLNGDHAAGLVLFSLDRIERGALPSQVDKGPLHRVTWHK